MAERLEPDDAAPANLEDPRKGTWFIIAAIPWLALLIVFFSVFIINGETPGRYYGIDTAINLLIGEAVILATTLLTALLLFCFDAPGRYQVRNWIPLGIGVLIYLVCLL